MKARDLMTPRPHVVLPDEPVLRPAADDDEVMKKMRRCKVRRVMVTDEDGVLQGVIAQADLVREEGEAHPRRIEKVLEAVSEPVGLPR